jgi:hypothetical protein
MSEQTQETNQPTSAAALRARSRPTITNPETGNSYVVRRATTESMIKSGYLPDDFFFTQAQALTEDVPEDEGADKLTADKLIGFKDDNLLRVEAITRAIVAQCLLRPRVVKAVEDDADESVVEYEDIPAPDRQYIRAWYEYRLEDSTINLKDGSEVTRQEVSNFPPGEQQSELDRAGDGGTAG